MLSFSFLFVTTDQWLFVSKTCRPVHIWRLKSAITQGSLALILSFFLWVLVIWGQIIRLLKRALLPTKPSYWSLSISWMLSCAAHYAFFWGCQGNFYLFFLSQKIRWGVMKEDTHRLVASVFLHTQCLIHSPESSWTAVFLLPPGVRQEPTLQS